MRRVPPLNRWFDVPADCNDIFPTVLELAGYDVTPYVQLNSWIDANVEVKYTPASIRTTIPPRRLASVHLLSCVANTSATIGPFARSKAIPDLV